MSEYERYYKKYYDDHKEDIARNQRKYKDRSGEKYLSVQRAGQKRRRTEVRLAVVSMLGGKCASCGISDIRVLQVDHVNGGGNAERRKFSNTYELYRHVLSVVGDGYQLLCANCNWIKRWDNEEFYSGEKTRKKST